MGAEEIVQRGKHISRGDISDINKLNHSKNILSHRISFLKSYIVENSNSLLILNIKNKVV
jgi:hypothetical protein